PLNLDDTKEICLEHGLRHEISDEDAEDMEGLEIEILAKLNIANPYQE
ncbi:hypothetical protein OPU39_12090, partial [Acinetobacter nosocomialis]|nr:hypothetical protein [Acinetobacter nosocomialis]